MENRKRKIDISHLPAGIYFVQIQTEKGIVTKQPCIRNTWVLETNEIRIRHHLKSDAKLIH